jgi:hypothetical protein
LKLEDIKKQFPDQWILLEVTKSDENDETIEAKPLYHHPNKEKVIQEMGQFTRGSGVILSVEFTGEIPEEWAVMF